MVDNDNNQVGVLSIEDALRMAEEAGLDLVEVASTAAPPVCKIMDYGQYKYQQSKKQHEAKRNQKTILVKEVKFRPKTEEHDFQFKLKHAIEFLEEGNKVKISVMFRGREMFHRELGEKLVERFLEGAKEYGQVEAPARMEGKNLTMILGPKKK